MGSSVGPRSVSERVRVEKSYRRTFSTTVLPERSAARSRWTHRSASRSTSLLTRTRSCRSMSKVSSTETDFASRSATTGRSSWPEAIRCSELPCALPSSRTSSASPASARSFTVVIPARRRWSAVAGPTPGRVRTGMGASISRSVPGSISMIPSGFASSEAILASILEPARPTDPLSPVTASIASRNCSPMASAEAAPSAVPPASRSTKVSVQAQWLHQRRQPAQQLHDLVAHRPVQREARHQVGGVRRQPSGLRHRHGRVDPETPGLVRGGGDDPARSQPAHHDRFAAQTRLRRLLGRGVEGIHVQMQDGRRGSHMNRCCPMALTIAGRRPPAGPGMSRARPGLTGSAGPVAPSGELIGGVVPDQRLAGVHPLPVQL